MTAILGFLFEDHVTIYTDGAVYDKGLYVLASPKTQIMLHQPCILATRGMYLTGIFLDEQIAPEPTFDRVVDTMADHMTVASKRTLRPGERVSLEVLFGGWSERAQEFQLHRMMIDGDNLESLVEGSLQLAPVRQWICEPWPDQKLLEECGLMREGEKEIDLRAGDPAIIQLMECQRKTTYPLGQGSEGIEGCLVGAFIQKTVLSRGGAVTAIIHRWPDKIGEPLGTTIE
jgi:hypothetical protein